MNFTTDDGLDPPVDLDTADAGLDVAADDGLDVTDGFLDAMDDRLDTADGVAALGDLGSEDQPRGLFSSSLLRISPHTILGDTSTAGPGTRSLASLPHALCILGGEEGDEVAAAALPSQSSHACFRMEPQPALCTLLGSPPSAEDRLNAGFADAPLLAVAASPGGARPLPTSPPLCWLVIVGADRTRALRAALEAEVVALREVFPEVAECLLPTAGGVAGVLGTSENPSPTAEKRRIPEEENLAANITPSLGMVHSILMAMLPSLTVGHWGL